MSYGRDAARRVTCEGGCHCGRVRFRLQVPERVQVLRCNCSICTMTGYQHLTMKREHFELLRGAEDLAEYRFNTGKARHLFCRHCGIKSFYVPRSHPDSYSVNCACVSLPKEVVVEWIDFDGANWERHIERIRDADN